MRAFLIVLDSVGIGEAPDAADYDDVGAHTLPHVGAACGGLDLPVLQGLGLGNIPDLLPTGKPIPGVPPHPHPRGAYGAMREMSTGKDTTTGHWEMAGLDLRQGFHVFPEGPPAFPPDLIAALEQETGRGTLGNKAASGTDIVDELGARHMVDGALIVYTSVDSVMQIAAHEDVVPLPELYRACTIARRLCNRFPVGRVIARPFKGTPGHFERTPHRKDFAFPPPEATILDRLHDAGVHTVTVGKVDDIFAHRGISESLHVGDNARAQAALQELAGRPPQPLFVFANLIDFDMLYGHRRDPHGYAQALRDVDRFFGDFLARLPPDDLVIITADHGNDPTFKGTDHTREYVPLLVRHPTVAGMNLGIREGFYDVAQSLANAFGIDPMPRGRTFLPRGLSR